jgi:hypothetical protein
MSVNILESAPIEELQEFLRLHPEKYFEEVESGEAGEE